MEIDFDDGRRLERQRSDVDIGSIAAAGDHLTAQLAKPVDRLANPDLQQASRFVEALVMLAELEEVDLFVVRVPVAADAREAGRAVMQRMRANADFCILERDDGSVEIGEATVGSGDDSDISLPLWGRAGEGGGFEHHLRRHLQGLDVNRVHDIGKVSIEDVFLAVGQLKELLPGPRERPVRQVIAELSQAEAEGMPARAGGEDDPALAHPDILRAHDLVVALVFEDAVLVNAGCMCEGIATNDRLIRLYRDARLP